MKQPLISVITINLNNEEGLASTLRSVKEQSFQMELVLVDGGSVDGSSQVWSQHRDIITHLISEKDKGIFHAMNKGIRISTGQYLLFLNSGDSFYDEDVIRKITPLLDGTDLIAGSIEILEKGQRTTMHSPETPGVADFMRLGLYHQSVFMSKSLFERYGYYDESFRIAGDYEFFIRAFLKGGCGYRRIDQTVASYPATGVSNSQENLAVISKERRRAWELNFSLPVLEALNTYYELRESPFAWIFRKTRKTGFFYYFFSFWNFVFLTPLRLKERMGQRTK